MVSTPLPASWLSSRSGTPPPPTPEGQAGHSIINTRAGILIRVDENGDRLESPGPSSDPPFLPSQQPPASVAIKIEPSPSPSFSSLVLPHADADPQMGDHTMGEGATDESSLPFTDLSGAYKWAEATETYVKGLEQTKDQLVAKIGTMPRPSVTPTPQNSPRLAAYRREDDDIDAAALEQSLEALEALSSLHRPSQPLEQVENDADANVYCALPQGEYGPGQLGDVAFVARFQNAMDSALEADEHLCDLSTLAFVSQYDRTLPATQSILNPTPPLLASGQTAPAAEPPNLQRKSEEAIMEPFWKVLCSVYPVILRDDFHAYYRTLWRPWSPNDDRRPCALTDAILALGAQHSVGRVAGEDQRGILVTSSYNVVMPSNARDMARIAAGYHTRALLLVQSELASPPSLGTAQTYVLLAVYLTHASLFNLARRTIAAAIDVTRLLHIRLASSSSSSSSSSGGVSGGSASNQKAVVEILIHIWAALWLLDVRTSQSIGCAPQMTETDGRRLLHATSSGHLDPRAAGRLHTPRRRREDAIRIPLSLSATVEHQLLRLMLSSRNIQDMFLRKRASLMREYRCFTIFDSTHVVETLARCLHYRIQLDVDLWERELPSQLRIVRDCVSPRPLFSAMDGYPSTASPYASAGMDMGMHMGAGMDPGPSPSDGAADEPLDDGLIYQRIHLEMALHFQLMILRRPFVRFEVPDEDEDSRVPSLEAMFETQLADKMASLAVEHAASLSYVLMLSQRVTDYFKGWPHLLQYQWDAFIVILGFLQGNNRCEHGFRQYARTALLTALSCLEMMSETSPVAMVMFDKAKKLVEVVSDLCGETLLETFQGYDGLQSMDEDEDNDEEGEEDDDDNGDDDGGDGDGDDDADIDVDEDLMAVLPHASQSSMSSPLTHASTPYSSPATSPSQLFFATSQLSPSIPAPVLPPMLHSMAFGGGGAVGAVGAVHAVAGGVGSGQIPIKLEHPQPQPHLQPRPHPQLHLQLPSQQRTPVQASPAPSHKSYRSSGSGNGNSSGSGRLPGRQHSPPTRQRKTVYGPELPPHLAEARACAALENLSFGNVRPSQGLPGSSRLSGTPSRGGIEKSPPRRRKTDRRSHGS